MSHRRLLVLALLAGCTRTATNHGNTVIYASGADLQSADPLITTHPLARQVQRYVLLTTLVQYDSLLHVRPYLGRRWEWSADSLSLTMHLATDLHWDDGVATTARDAAWTLTAARDPVTGYPRSTDLRELASAVAVDDSTLRLRFDARQSRMPDVLTDLAIAPAHLLDTVPRARLRQAAWEQHPVGNGPFVFVSHTPNRRWVFAARPDFPADLGGPPRIDRLVIAIVDEPTTKLAALTSGELDFAGIQPADARFVAADPRLAVLRYPLLLTYVIAFNTRRAPFNDVSLRRAVSLALDRPRIVAGYLFGFGRPAASPVSPPGDTVGLTPRPDSARTLLRGRVPSFELLTVGSGDAAMEQLIQAQLADVGIDTRIRQLELTTFLARVDGPEHDFQAAVMGVSGDIDLGQLGPLLDVTGMAHDSSRADMLRRFADSMPVAVLYQAVGLQGMNRRVRDVRMDVRGELATVRKWYIAP